MQVAMAVPLDYVLSIFPGKFSERVSNGGEGGYESAVVPADPQERSQLLLGFRLLVLPYCLNFTLNWFDFPSTNHMP